MSQRFGKQSLMGLVCGTLTNFMPTHDNAQMAQGMTKTPALGGFG